MREAGGGLGHHPPPTVTGMAATPCPPSLEFMAGALDVFVLLSSAGVGMAAATIILSH